MILQKLRREKGVTQQQTADACGVTRSTITMIELGINRPSVKLAKKLSVFFGVDWVIFFDENVS